MSTKESSPNYLDITAISARNGISSIERWRLASPFTTSTEAGMSAASLASLGNTDHASYVVIPPHFDGGLHHAPTVQYVAFLAGEAVISIPETGQSITIKGGKDGLIIAADTADVSKMGHETRYPSGEQTAAIAIPIQDGKLPEHTTL
ncbi:MAG: hypothetical protein LQ343_005949 [Gyalolechia ehrenbergii]|nr:MAG: hypothetical protein LQ343_005949 [Gyalolechia ehrenbergii]